MNINIQTVNIKLDLNLTNKEDVIRLQNAINRSLELNIGSSQIIKQEVHIFAKED